MEEEKRNPATHKSQYNSESRPTFVTIQTSNYLALLQIMHSGYFIDIFSCILLYYLWKIMKQLLKILYMS